MTVYTMNTTGPHLVTLGVTWEGQHAALTHVVWVYFPLADHHAIFTTPALTHTPPGTIIANISIISQGELPTLLMGSIDWGDGQPNSVVNLTDITQPGSKGHVDRSYSHNYTRNGNFMVLLSLANPISNTQLSSSVRVVEHITLRKVLVHYLNKDDIPAWPSTVFKTNAMLNFTAVVESGIATRFKLLVNGEKKTSDNPYIMYTFQRAGMFNVSMTASGEAGASHTVVVKVKVEQPLKEHSVQLRLPDKVVWPPAKTTAVINVTSREELPTHVSGTVSWGDGKTVTEVNMTDDTPPGSSGSATRLLTQEYQQPGHYLVMVHLSNSVSQVNISKMVLVLAQLSLDKIVVVYQNESDAPAKTTDIFKTDVPLVLTAVEKGGVSSNFTLIVNGKNITSKSPSFVYTFTTAGEHIISMKSCGEAGTSLAVTKTLQVARPVKEDNLLLLVPKLVVWPPGEANVTIKVISNEELPTNVTGFVNWNDGEPDTAVDLTKETSPGTHGLVTRDLLHTYSQPGNYLVSLFLQNLVSQANVTTTLLVLDHLTLGGILVEYEDSSESSGSYDGVFKTHVPLNITALIKTGFAEEFILTVNNEVLTSSTPTFIYTFQKAGEYEVTMRTLGDVGTSNTMFTRVIVARPLTEENAVIEAPEYVVAPPGETNVTLMLISMEEVPTNVTGWISWGDGEAVEEVNLVGETPAGARGPVSRVLKHTYLEPDHYVLSWYMKNPVSQVNLSHLVPVIHQLELSELVITLEAGDNTLTRPEHFYFLEDTVSIRLGSIIGQADRYILSVSGQQDQVQTTPIFNLTFDRESDYEVTVVAEGMGGTSNIVSGWVRVRAKLHGLEVEVSDTEIRAGMEVTFRIRAPLFLGACLTVDLGDGHFVGWKRADKCEGQKTGHEEWEEVQLSELMTLTHTYLSRGIYNSTVKLFSIMGELQETIKLTVLESLPCDKLHVWIQKNGTLEAPFNMTRAQKVWIRSFAEINCTVPEIEMDIGWRIVHVNDSKEVDLLSVGTTKSVLYLPVRTLHYGLYRAIVSYNISMIKPEGVAVWTVLSRESVIEVGKSILMVVMVKGGAPRVRRGTLQTLSLVPGQVSYDPDYPEIPLVSYVWSCRLVDEELPERSVISDPPASRDSYDGKKDQGGCWGQGPAWMTTTDPMFNIDVDIFRNPHKTYSLQIIARSRDGRENTAALEVEVVEGNPPTLASGCDPPWFCRQITGAQLVNPAKLIIKSGCELKPGEEPVGEDGCGEVPLQYSWKIFGVESSGGGTKLLDITGVAIGEHHYKLALLDEFWEKYGSLYNLFDVVVTAHRAEETSEGLALQRIQINKAPIGGTCRAKILELTNEDDVLEESEREVVPTLSVTAVVDTVLCNCSDWQDPEGFEIPKYSFFALTDQGEKMILTFGLNNGGQMVLPYANLTLWAAISDNMDAETHFLIANIDPLLPSKTAFEEYMARNLLTKAVGARDQTKVDMLLRAEKSLKGITLPDETDYNEKTKGSEEDGDITLEKNKNMLGAADKFSATSMDEVIQVNNILRAVAYPLPKENQASAVEMLVTLSMSADKEAPLSQQKDFVAGALATTANLMKGINKSMKSNVSEATNEVGREMSGITRARRKRMAVNESLSLEEEDNPPYEPSEDDRDANDKVEKMLEIVGSSQGALLQASVVGEEPAKIDAGDQVNMAVGFFDAAELGGKVVEVGGAVYVFPNYCAITRQEPTCLTNKSITIGVQMAKWKGQVHGYGGGRDQLSDDSATVQLSLVDATSTPIPVNNSLEDFIMYIPRSQETVSEPTLIEPRVSSKMGLSIHNIIVPAPRVAVTLLVRPENDSDGDDWVLAWSSSTLNSSLEYADNLVSFSDLTYHPDSGFYELFLDSETISNVTGMYSVGIGRYNMTIPQPQEHPCFEDPPNNTVLLSYDTSFNSTYFFSTFTSSCLFFNKELLTWSSDGCKVIGANSTVTVCACNHLSSFGSGFFIMPNTIDFSYVFANAGFADNLTIYLVLIISLGLYFIILIYARIMDKKDVEKVGATPLPDNKPNDHYLYNIMVHTGQLPNSGTKSKVHFLLVGDWDETDVRTLNDEQRPLLTRGASDHFIMAAERSLGPLHYLRIWHDNSGKGKDASWFFSYMVVRDIQTGEEFQFISNEWLAVEEGDGQIDRLVAVAGEQQLKEYSHVFGKTVQKNLADDHLWFSVFLRPPRSRFTRVQRLSSCMALLYLSMLVNAMFYQKVPDTPGTGGLNLGIFTISAEALGVGFLSNFIVFPPSFCIVFFFRKSRPRNPKTSRLKVALGKQNASVHGDEAASGVPKTSLSGASAKDLPITPAMLENKKNPDTEATKIKRKKKVSLPWWCVIIAWVLCATSITVAVFFLWAYGIQFGNEKATKWLTALISSICSSILFTQPIKIYLMAMLLSWILRRPLDEFEDYDDDEEEFELGNDEELLHGPPTSQGNSRRSHAQVGAGLSEEELAACKDRRKRELAMQELMLEILVYLIFLTIILCISYGSRDPNIFLMRNNVANTFVHYSTSECPAFAKAKFKDQFWCWSKEILVPNLLNTTLYNGKHRPQEMCGTLLDRITFLLGHAIIRQIRMQPGDPSEHPALHDRAEDKQNFGRSWNISGPVDSNYQYKSALKIHGFPYDGILSSYGGGGYLVELKGGQSKVMRILNSLEAQNWVDEHTKALFVEFAVFNPQVNLFAVAMFIFEFIPGGGILTKYEFQGLRLLRYHTPGGVFILASEIAYILFTFFYTRREYKSLKKLGCSYFKSIWNLFEIWVIALSYTAIIFYLLKTSLTYYTLDKFTATKGKTYIRMQPLAFLDDVLGYVIAFQVFIGTLKLLKLLRFNKRIGMLSATLKHASGDILGFGLFFSVLFISFVSFFYLNTLTTLKDFSTFVKAAEACFFLITKKFEEIRSGAPVIGPVFYFIFAFIMYWIVFQLLIAIICHSFAKVSQDISSQPNDYEVVDYIISRMSAYLSSLRPNSVQRVNIPPPKPPDIQSQLWHINASLDRSLAALDRALPMKKGRGM
nr:uncharacterized protein LOC123770009 [Procambarus clarkii]